MKLDWVSCAPGWKEAGMMLLNLLLRLSSVAKLQILQSGASRFKRRKAYTFFLASLVLVPCNFLALSHACVDSSDCV